MRKISIFTVIKQRITAADAAEYYSLKKSGKLYKCPFHADNIPSMQADERFYCYGCGKTGDAIDLVSKLFNLRPKAAAEKIAADFGLSACDNNSDNKKGIVISTDKNPRKLKLEAIENLIEYEKILNQLITTFEPKPDDDTMSQAFLITRRKLDMIDDILYRFYQNPTDDEINILIKNEILKGVPE